MASFAIDVQQCILSWYFYWYMEPVNSANTAWKTASFSTKFGYNDISLLSSGHRIRFAARGSEKPVATLQGIVLLISKCRIVTPLYEKIPGYSEATKWFELPSQHWLAASLQGLQQMQSDPIILNFCKAWWMLLLIAQNISWKIHRRAGERWPRNSEKYALCVLWISRCHCTIQQSLLLHLFFLVVLTMFIHQYICPCR